MQQGGSRRRRRQRRVNRRGKVCAEECGMEVGHENNNGGQARRAPMHFRHSPTEMAPRTVSRPVASS